MMEGPPPYPTESWSDKLHLVARAGMSAAPFIGGSALEFFNYFIAPPIQTRREEWVKSVYESLNQWVSRLEQENSLRWEDLSNNDEFVSAFIQVSVIAVKNHQKEKLDALRNAVVNVAMGHSPEDSKRELFLRFVDDLTVLHLEALVAFRNHDRRMHGRSHVRTSISEIAARLQELVPNLQSQSALAEIVVNDLCQCGLLFWNRSGGATRLAGLNQVADLGIEFLDFISQPKGSFPCT